MKRLPARPLACTAPARPKRCTRSRSFTSVACRRPGSVLAVLLGRVLSGRVGWGRSGSMPVGAGSVTGLEWVWNGFGLSHLSCPVASRDVSLGRVGFVDLGSVGFGWLGGWTSIRSRCLPSSSFARPEAKDEPHTQRDAELAAGNQHQNECPSLSLHP